MPKPGRCIAGFVVIALLVAFIISYREIYPPTVNLPPIPHAPETPVNLAEENSQRLSMAMAIYHDRNGCFPTLAEFWQSVGHTPLKNTVTGRDTVVALSRDVDARDVGWVYDEAKGAVDPGGIFGATTLPTSRPGS